MKFLGCPYWINSNMDDKAIWQKPLKKNKSQNNEKKEFNFDNIPEQQRIILFNVIFLMILLKLIKIK